VDNLLIKNVTILSLTANNKKMAFKIKFFGGHLTRKSAGFFARHDAYNRKIWGNRIANSRNHRNRARELSNIFGRVAGGKRLWVS